MAHRHHQVGGPQDFLAQAVEDGGGGLRTIMPIAFSHHAVERADPVMAVGKAAGHEAVRSSVPRMRRRLGFEIRVARWISCSEEIDLDCRKRRTWIPRSSPLMVSDPYIR